jgi:hypothetical protein
MIYTVGQKQYNNVPYKTISTTDKNQYNIILEKTMSTVGQKQYNNVPYKTISTASVV